MLKLKFKKSDKIDEAFGISEERHHEFAVKIAKLAQKCLAESYGKSDVVSEINKFAKNDNEIAYGILLFGLGMAKIEDRLDGLIR